MYAQALIDNDQVLPAIEWLEDTRKRIKSASNQKGINAFKKPAAECAGLLGRAHKELFLRSLARDKPLAARHFERSIRNYGKIFNDSAFEDYPDRTWHGINLATLARRAAIARIDHDTNLKRSVRIAKTVLEILNRRKGTNDATEWDAGTAVEANLLLGSVDQALKCTVEYCNAGHDRFQYRSTLRQFSELLELDSDDETFAKILRLLRATTLHGGGGSEVEVKDPQREKDVVDSLTGTQFQAVFGDTEYKALRWYRLGLKCAESVGKISSVSGAAQGTGFLARGGDFDSQLGDTLVVVTNSHVISADIKEQRSLSPRSLPPGKAVIRFHASSTPQVDYTFERVHANSHRNKLDYSILLFEGKEPPIEPLTIQPVRPQLNDKPRAYVIGHPLGGEMSFSIQDNRLSGYDPDGSPQKVLYRSPTRGGSSGSPVFNEDWEVFALHHAAVRKNNQGVLMSRIIKTANKSGP